MAVTREISFEIDRPRDEALELVVRALVDIRCSRFGREDYVVTARTGFSWRSFGEVVSVRLTPRGEGRTRVEASSSSSLSTVIFDWGANASNLRRFEAALHARLAEPPAPKAEV